MNETVTQTNSCGIHCKGIRGQLLTFKADPFLCREGKCHDYLSDGLIVIQDGRIIDVGDYGTTIKRHPGLNETDTYSDALILPGFIDCHAHYVQAPVIGSSGNTLLRWLDRYVFPMESRFRDKIFADEVAREFMAEMLTQGTTTANVFSTTFETSVDAIFEESERYNTRMITGKVLQDRNISDSLKDESAEESILLTEKLLKKWHHRGRQLYAVIPRFAPTSTPRQLELAGELYQRYMDRGVYMHTHLDEVQSEIDWVTQLFPDQPNYTEVYRHFGLVGGRSIMAHCCIVREEEWQTLHDNECGVAHCPSSNLFLGDGEFKYWEAKEQSRPVRVGMGTDVGGGTSLSILRQIGEAYKVAMMHGRSLDIMKSLYMATRGGAEALHLEHTIGSIASGYEADLTVLDLKPDRFAAWRLNFAESITEKLFVLSTIAPAFTVKATYVAGRKVYDRERKRPLMYASDPDIS